MKFPAAALFLLAVTPTSDAFLPAAQKVPSAAFLGSDRRRQHFGFWSTTEDNIEIAHQALNKNNIPQDQQHKEGLIETSEKTVFRKSAAELAEIAAAETKASAAAYMAQYEGQSGASIIYSKLVENGVTVVNGFSGGAVLPLLDQFHEGHPRHKGNAPAIRWITNSNESSAGHIAEGYGKSQPLDGPHLPVGVVVATSGPGLTNLITPLQDAICDGVPVVALCGQAATNAPKDAFQSAPAVDLTRPCTKWAYKINSAAELPIVMDYAFYVARNGRPGPVFVDLPKDLQNQVLTSEMIDEFVQTNLGENNSGIAASELFHMQERRRADGTIFQSLDVGTEGKKLPFEFAFQPDGTYKLNAVPPQDQDVDDHHADHHPTHVVTKHYQDGSIKEEVLSENQPLTSEMLKLIKHARKPVILAGQGCNDSSAELKAFAEALQIPVATTLHALGCFDERHNLALNMVGMHGHPTPNFMFQEADLVICIGSRFDDRITGRMGSYIPEARRAQEEGRGGVIHVDIRRTEKAKQLIPTFFVHSTAKNFIKTMNESIAKQAYVATIKPSTGAWLERMRELQRDFPVLIPKFRSDNVKVTDPETGEETTIVRTRMSCQSVIAEMNRQLLNADKMDDAIFTTGVGVHQMIAAQLITWTQPRQMLSSGSLGTMGVSLGYAIGAKLANGKKIVISVDGDGSFNMTFTELKTVAEEKIPVKLMIIDNDGQMMVEYWQRLFHDNRLLAVRNSANPNYTLLAKAFGIKSLYCDAEEDLENVMKEFLFSDPEEPVLFHVKVERTPCLPLVAPGQPLDDMILEDVEVDVDGMAAPS